MERGYILERLVEISNNWRECAKSNKFTEREQDVYDDCADDVEQLIEDAATT